MEYVEDAMNPGQEHIGASLVMLKELMNILNIGPVEIRILMNSYNNHNSMLSPMQVFSNGYLLKTFKMLLTLPEVGLVKFIQLNGLRDVFIVGILKIKDG